MRALIEVGANRGCHRVDETAKNAVLIEAFDGVERGLDRRGDFGLAHRVLRGRGAELRIETDVEEAHDLRGDGEMLAQRRPHVVLRKRHAHLAQET